MTRPQFTRLDTRGLRQAVHAGSLLLALVATHEAVAQEAEALQDLNANWALLDQYCVGCHNVEDWAGSLAFDTLSPESVADNPAVFEKAIRKMRGRLMPPPGNDRPASEDLDRFVAQLEKHLDNVASEHGSNPGHIAIHRLNRREYQNAIEDLLGVKVDAEDLLPTDIASDGFDNVANVLQVSPAFLEQYMQAARAISIDAVSEAEPEPDVASFEAPSLATQYRHVDGLPLGTRGGFSVEHYFPADGEYVFNVDIASQEGSLQRSYPTWWLESEHRFILTIDGEEVYTATLGGKEDEAAVDLQQTPAITAIQERFMDIRLPVKAGSHQIAAGFVARTFAESDRIVDHLSPGEGQDNIPVVVSFKAFGPMNAAGRPDVPSRRKIFSCYPENNDAQRPCAEQILATLARQAFRRPVTTDDMATLLGFYDAGQAQGGFETGIQKALMAMLASTKFLYRAEPLPEDAKPGAGYPVTDMELASRLSFFLWSRGPDEELLTLAENGTLRDSRVLREQVQRMLADPRASALTQNFAFQWLKIDDVDAIDPDPRLFPDFDADLRASLKQELTLFVDSILRGDHAVVDLLDAKHTYLNERLARHYGIDSVRGAQFRRVSLADERRHGLLGKGGILLLTSYPNRTSPVLRGAYILETLIGTPPAAPPPGVETDLDTRAPGEEIKTLRLRLEAHREQPSCNQCHGVIDPLGLALENFNAIGQWQDIDRYARAPIDAVGRLATGEPVAGPVDLYQALRERPEQFVQALTEKLMTYALGRTVEHFDMPIVRNVVRQAASADYRFAAIVQGIVESDAFQMKSLPTEEHAAETLSMSD
jgi:mono/diheme cytochrome c family protein